MTAEIGMGANMGIESAVYLCNILHREFGSHSTRHVANPELTALFSEYQAGRHQRVSAYVEMSGHTTRHYSYQTYFGRLFVGYIAPYMMPMQRKAVATSFAKGPKVAYAPTRTTNEGAEGWQLGQKMDNEKGWLWRVSVTVMLVASFAYFRS
jgi:hypothetical protein